MGDVEIRLQNIKNDDSSSDTALNHSQGFAVPDEDEVPSQDIAEPNEDEVPSQDIAEPNEDEVPSQDIAVPDEDTLAAAMEAILFAMGDAVPVDSIAQALGVSRERALEAADVLSERCRQAGSGVALNWYEDSLQLSTKPELYEYLIRIASEPKKPRLTPTLLETLSIIAFRQPVTRMEVENIRGVNSDFAINRLISFDLVEEVGRKEVPGRPLLFGTTQQFLRSFGIRSVEELPEPDSSRMELFREEAEEEVSTKLNI